MKIVRVKLKELLNQKGISQRELSRITEIRFPTINQMCVGEAKHIPLDNLAIICEVLDCDISDVLELVDQK